MQNRKQQLKKLLFRIAQFTLIAFITLVMLEMVLGIVFRIKDRNLIKTETLDYPYFYFKLSPENGVRNADGFKTNYTRKKPEGVTRIAITGGSVAYGNEPEHSIAFLLENELHRMFPDSAFEVINAGVPAFVIEQEFIMIQLVLQYYQPDIIVSISGYNDLISADINRYYPCEDLLPPHHWNNFRAIGINSGKQSLPGRFFGAFPNLARLFDFAQRKMADENKLYAALSLNSQNIASVYAQRVQDTYDFCKAKNIRYIHCLQPVNWSWSSNSNSLRTQSLQALYSNIQHQLDTCSYVLNITELLNAEQAVFLDECHVSKEGNQEISEKILLQIK